MLNKQKLSLSISPRMLAKAKRVAKKQHRSVSSLIEYLIDQEWSRSQPKSQDNPSGIYRLSRIGAAKK